MMSYLVRRENFADGTPPPKKPYSAVEFKNSTDTLLQGVYGTGKSSNAFLVDLMQKELDKAVTEGVVTMQEGLEFIKSRKKYYDDYLKEQSKTTDGPIGLPEVEERVELATAGFIKGGSRTPPEFKGKWGVRTLVNVPENTPGYLGKSGEQVVFATEKDANRFIKQDLDTLVAEGRITKEARPEVAKTAKEINNFVDGLIKKGNKKIYLNDIIDEFEGTKSIYDSDKNLSRKEVKVRIKQALPEDVYNKLIKTTGTDPRITAEKKVKFNKLVLDVTRGDLPITALGSEARGTTQNIKQYLTEANKKRFDKILPKLRAINARVSQPREIYTADDIKNISQTTTKTFDKMTKNFPTSIESRTQVFKGGTRFYDAKSYILSLLGRHTAQGGELYKHVGGDTMKDVKFRNTQTGKLITIRNIDLNNPEFKEAAEAYKDFEKIKNTPIDNPLDPNKKISINEAIKQGSGGKDYLVIDHGDGVKNNPLKNLIVTSQKQNIGFQLANLNDAEKKLFYRNKLDLKGNINRFSKYGERLLLGGTYKTPKQTVEFLNPQKSVKEKLLKIPGVTTADKVEQPEKSKIRNMFDSFNQKIKNAGNAYRSIRPGIDALTTAFPGKADNAIAAAIDFPMMYMSGAPFSQAAASAGSMFMNNPNIGKMANVALEQAALSEEEQFLKNAMERRQGLESMLENIPARFRKTIEENKGVKDETETYVP
jgi:hypothetical protein